MPMKNLCLLMTIFLLCLSGFSEAQQTRASVPAPGYEIVVYPDEIFFGDPVYIGIRRKNISKEAVRYMLNDDHRSCYWLTLRSYNVSAPYYLLHDESILHHPHPARSSLVHNYQPDESKLTLVAYQELPALEDMNVPDRKSVV